LKEIAAVKREMGAWLMVDEAHSLGVLGAHGRGLTEEAGVEADVDFVVGTFSKSLGSVGGFCVSDIEGFDVLRVGCRPYMFTASLPPSVMTSTITALKRMQAAPELRTKLHANAHRLYNGLKGLGFKVGPQPNPIVSVELEDPILAVTFWNKLLDGGVYLNLALPPATPTNHPLLRSSVSAAHNFEQIDRVVALFESVGRQLGVLTAEAHPRRAAHVSVAPHRAAPLAATPDVPKAKVAALR
jgi:8-amino-7-oxononanoate synthase